MPRCASCSLCARAFVGNDSGLGHMAAALGLPALTIFGPGRPLRYRPWGPRSDWLRAPDRRLESVSAAQAAERLRLLLLLQHEPQVH